MNAAALAGLNTAVMLFRCQEGVGPVGVEIHHRFPEGSSTSPNLSPCSSIIGLVETPPASSARAYTSSEFGTRTMRFAGIERSPPAPTINMESPMRNSA